MYASVRTVSACFGFPAVRRLGASGCVFALHVAFGTEPQPRLRLEVGPALPFAPGSPHLLPSPCLLCLSLFLSPLPLLFGAWLSRPALLPPCSTCQG